MKFSGRHNCQPGKENQMRQFFNSFLLQILQSHCSEVLGTKRFQTILNQSFQKKAAAIKFFNNFDQLDDSQIVNFIDTADLRKSCLNLRHYCAAQQKIYKFCDFLVIFRAQCYKIGLFFFFVQIDYLFLLSFLTCDIFIDSLLNTGRFMIFPNSLFCFSKIKFGQ